MKKNFCLSLSLLVALLGSTPVVAAEPATTTNSVESSTNFVALNSIVAEIMEKNPELEFYRAQIAAAKGGRRAAGEWANPELGTEFGRKTTRAPGLDEEGVAWSVSIQQTIEWPGRIPLRKAIANQEVKLAELGLAQFKAALASRAQSLAYNLFAAQEKSAAARDVADRFQALREVLVQRDPAGLTPALETRIIESTELAMQRKASESMVEVQSALLELNQLRGAPLDARIRIAEPNLHSPNPPSLEVLLEAARTNNFELQMRIAELEQQGFKVSLAKNERFPSFSVGPFFSRERAGETENIAGIGLSIPLPLWNRNKGNIETASARLRQAEAILVVTQRELERKVAGEYMRYKAKVEEMAKWRPDSVEKFREAAALADRHYRLGAVPIATYVELQKQYLEAVEVLLDTRREALQARQELRVLTGLEINSGLTPAPEGQSP